MDSNDVCKLPKSKFKEGDKVRLTFKITGFDSKKNLTIKSVKFVNEDELYKAFNINFKPCFRYFLNEMDMLVDEDDIEPYNTININITAIDTGSHGYYSISKKDLIKINYPIENISSYSGMNLTRIFLEEDCDASNFINFCEEKGNIKYKIKNSYNPNHNITHNYNHKLFNLKLDVGDKILMYDDTTYEVIEHSKNIIILGDNGRYKLPKTNPFKFIKDIIK